MTGSPATPQDPVLPEPARQGPAHRWGRRVVRLFELAAALYVLLVAFLYVFQRSLLYHPSHGTTATQLTAWLDGNRTIGYCREVSKPNTIWLMLHGNAGQAAHRDYALSHMSPQDSLYVLEYPGYGQREGRPSLASINRAASEAYQLLRTQHPGIPVCVLGESIGSGPACVLAAEKVPPDKIVLVVPFDTLVSVASEHAPFLPVRLVLRDAWNNVQALKHYAGPVEIFGATVDHIIPVAHAKALANQTPNAQFTMIAGGHNDWPDDTLVKIRR